MMKMHSGIFCNPVGIFEKESRDAVLYINRRRIVLG